MNDMTTVTTAKDWASDQEVRWCPGCGDYAILSAVTNVFPMIILLIAVILVVIWLRPH